MRAPTLVAILTLAFSAAACIHFAIAVVQTRKRDRRAAFVSAALCFMSLLPVLTLAVTRGHIPRERFAIVEWALLGVGSFLVVAILRVGPQDEQRRAVRLSKQQAADFAAQIRAQREED